MKATHKEKRRGKDEQQITKWEEHLPPAEKKKIQLEWSNNKTESDLSDEEKP